jgi:hypothetical protein
MLRPESREICRHHIPERQPSAGVGRIAYRLQLIEIPARLDRSIVVTASGRVCR